MWYLFLWDTTSSLLLGAGHVPFVNRPFESEIHGTVNFTYFCCVLLVTWCYRVLLSCYLRPKERWNKCVQFTVLK